MRVMAANEEVVYHHKDVLPRAGDLQGFQRTIRLLVMGFGALAEITAIHIAVDKL